ncbi:hypothetical protein [Pseudomonas sp. 2FE]|uniref:hypothetical protein n=1 Tax=Pseudomonas sp. 2FE TaxID=2502190 RepID=UPI0010F44C0C|nr:hypothetical protein [Pseudomonas sp. 2FE]
MTGPLERATSSPPPTLGEGCVRRYDPEALSDEHGTAFPDAAELWVELTQSPATVPEQPPGKPKQE